MATSVFCIWSNMPATHDSKPFVFARGPLIVSLESLFWHVQRYPRRRVAPHRPPLTETARPRELEQPYRVGHARVFRFPLTRRALVLGYWEPADLDNPVLADDEGTKLLEAVEGAHIPGITATEIADWARARDVVGWWRRLVAWVRRRTASAPAQGAVADDDELDGWQADVGYSVLPWSPADDAAVIDLEAARVRPW